MRLALLPLLALVVGCPRATQEAPVPESPGAHRDEEKHDALPDKVVLAAEAQVPSERSTCLSPLRS